MEYTYSAYRNLMRSLRDNGYTPIRFCDVSEDIDHPVIIRHDVDMDLQEAVNLAKIEKEEVKQELFKWLVPFLNHIPVTAC